MKRGVVIVAGGDGRRMGSEIPKQYLELNGKPVVVHTLEKFLRFDPGIKIVLVMAPDHQKFLNALSLPAQMDFRIWFAKGGATRYDSVKSGLELLEEDFIIGIHDAVRPLVSLETLERCYNHANQTGSAIPVIEVDETIRMIKDGARSEHLDRSKLRRVQTPQVFRSDLLKKAYGQPFNKSFTDDASVFESFYNEVNLVEGNRENIKITTPMDLQLASQLILTMP